jgi:hypothetical protein
MKRFLVIWSPHRDPSTFEHSLKDTVADVFRRNTVDEAADHLRASNAARMYRHHGPGTLHLAELTGHAVTQR